MRVEEECSRERESRGVRVEKERVESCRGREGVRVEKDARREGVRVEKECE